MSAFQQIFYGIGLGVTTIWALNALHWLAQLRRDIPMIRKNLRFDREQRKFLKHLKNGKS